MMEKLFKNRIFKNKNFLYDGKVPYLFFDMTGLAIFSPVSYVQNLIKSKFTSGKCLKWL